MNQQYEVCIGGQTVGKVQVLRQGLYYRFISRCNLNGGIPYRMMVRCNGKLENLGVLVPMGNCFGLDTKIAVKHLGEGTMEFSVVPKQKSAGRQFVPISPEEPFAYISRLKESFFAINHGQTGVLIK